MRVCADTSAASSGLDSRPRASNLGTSTGWLSEGPASGIRLGRVCPKTSLPRLVERGWATSREVVQDKRPNKQLYRITPNGRTALAHWLERPPGAEPERDMLLVKVFFGELAGESTVLEHIRRRKAEAAELRAQLRAFDRAAPASEHALYPSLTRRYGIMWAQFVIRWANEAERAILDARR